MGSAELGVDIGETQSEGKTFCTHHQTNCEDKVSSNLE